MEHLRTDGAKLAVADGRANVILKDGAIGAGSILVRVDTHIVREPLREKLRDRLLRRFDVAAVDFERDKSTSIGCLSFLACSAARDFPALAGFAADLDRKALQVAILEGFLHVGMVSPPHSSHP